MISPTFVKMIGILSPSSENVNNEPDPTPVLVQRPVLNFPILRPGAAVINLSKHPMASPITSFASQKLTAWNIHVTLLGQHKYMVNDCLGIKVSAGEFAMQFGNVQFNLSAGGAELVFTIDRIALNALTVRVRPNVGDPMHLCNFSGRITVGGAASNIRIVARAQPQVDLDTCGLVSLGTVGVDVQIGGLNLKPLQNDLDAVAKEMIADAIAVTLGALLPAQLVTNLTSYPNGLCVSKRWFYQKYMEILSNGVSMFNLPDAYVTRLQPFYPHADLRTARFGYSNRQPPHNAITDCTSMYFNDQAFVANVGNASFDLTNDDLRWLYHELRHVEQCAEWGGRDAYADRWFTDVPYSVLVNLLNLDTGASIPNLHNWMPMEADATARAQQVYTALTGKT